MCRYALLPHIIKRRIITILETNNNQICQKNQTVWKSDTQGDKEQTFIQTGRRGRDRQPGQRGYEARWWLATWGWGGEGGQSHIHVCINREEQLGHETNHATQISSSGKESFKTFGCKTCGGFSSGRNCQSHRTVCWRGSQGPRTNPQTHPLGNQCQGSTSKGTIHLWVAVKVG